MSALFFHTMASATPFEGQGIGTPASPQGDSHHQRAPSRFVVFSLATHQILQNIPEDNNCMMCYGLPSDTIDGKVQQVFVHIMQTRDGEVYHWAHETCLKTWYQTKAECPTCRSPFKEHDLLPKIDTLFKLGQAIMSGKITDHDPAISFGTIAVTSEMVFLGAVLKLKTIQGLIRSKQMQNTPILYSATILKNMTYGGSIGGTIIPAIVCLILGRQLAQVVQKRQNHVEAKGSIQTAQIALAAISIGTALGGLSIAGVVTLASYLRNGPSLKQAEVLQIVASVAKATLAAGSIGFAVGAVSTQIVS